MVLEIQSNACIEAIEKIIPTLFLWTYFFMLMQEIKKNKTTFWVFNPRFLILQRQ